MPTARRTASAIDRVVGRVATAIFCASIAIVLSQPAAGEILAAQNPAPQGGAAQPPAPGGAEPQSPTPAPAQDSGRGLSPAARRPPPTVTPQSYAPEQVQSGQRVFAAQCGFCHGRDAMGGGESGPDLTRSTVVAEDNRGDRIGPVVRNGRNDKGMPPFNLSDGDLAAVVAFIHDAKSAADNQLGGRRTVDGADLQTGNVDAGHRYFGTACARCHDASGDLAGIATKYKGLALLQRMLYPAAGRGGGAAPKPPQATVTLPSGQTVTGKLAFRDEFTITITDGDGWNRSWPVSRVKVTVDNPLEAHFEQLGKYTDDDMHDVLAYLQTLK